MTYTTSPTPKEPMKSQTKSNILIGAFFGMLLTPILTGMAIKEDNPEAHLLMKGLCFGAATAVAAYGTAREVSPGLRAQRMKERRLENASFALDRQRDILTAQRRMDAEVNKDEIARNAAIARMGVMSSSLLNPEVVAYAIPQIINPTGATQTAAAVTTQGKVLAGLDPALLTGGSTGDEYAPEEVIKIYQAMMNKKERNSLNTMIAGGSGDGKSFTMQALVDAWLSLNEDGIILVVDRKNGSVPDGGKYEMLKKPGWGGAPTYRDIKDVTKAMVPFSHVYGAMNPKLDIYLQWIWDYIKKYRRPAEEAVDGEYAILDKKADPLYSKETKRPAPILLIVDDATAVMKSVSDGENGRDAFQNATNLLTTIATEGRTDGIDLFWITHSVTLGDNKVPTPMLTAMKAIVGASLCNRSVMQHCGQSESISPEILAKVQAQVAAGTGKYGMATSYPKIPYLPPCNANPDTLLWGDEFIKHERALRWMIHSPAPRVLDAVHHYVLRVNGYKLGKKGVIERQDGQPLAAPYAVAKESREDLTPKQFIDIWYKEKGLDEDDEPAETIAA